MCYIQTFSFLLWVCGARFQRSDYTRSQEVGMDLIQGYGSNSCSDDDPDSELDEMSGLHVSGNAGGSTSTSEASTNAQKRRQETIDADASSTGATKMVSTALKRHKRKRESEHGTSSSSSPVPLSFTI